MGIREFRKSCPEVGQVNKIRRSTSGRQWFFLLAAAIFVFLPSSSPLCAQTSSIADRLPPETVAYLRWAGKNFAGSAQEKNHLMQLLQDPDFAPFRDALVKASQGSGGKDTKPTSFGFPEILSLLENTATIGVAVNPPVADAAAESDPSRIAAAFLVYDATGKKALIEKLRALQQANAKDKPVVTTYNFGATPVEVRTTAGGSSYVAWAANYYLVADQKPLIEDLIARFRSAEKPASSVAQLPEYHSIRPYVGPDSTLEFFARMPDMKKLLPPDKQDSPVARASESLHWEKVHVWGGGLSFAGEATRFRGAVLGDTTPPSLFDIAGASGATFVTLPALNPGPPFHILRLDLAAMYQLMRAAAMQSLTPQQTAGIPMAEAMAQGYLGMSVEDALHLFTGEFATQSVYFNDGTSSQLFVVTIQKAPDVLRILRATLGKKIISEDTIGDTTILDLSYPGTDPISGKPKPQLYYVAVAPQMIFVASRKAVVRAALERFNAKSGGGSASIPFSSAELNRMRTLLPEKLSGMSAVDLARFPWDKFFAQIAQQFNEQAKASNEATPQIADWLKLIKPEVFSRYLHAGISGWWKDANGIYFDSYVQ
jgi:hypothetical protein